MQVQVLIPRPSFGSGPACRSSRRRVGQTELGEEGQDIRQLEFCWLVKRNYDSLFPTQYKFS